MVLVLTHEKKAKKEAFREHLELGGVVGALTKGLRLLTTILSLKHYPLYGGTTSKYDKFSNCLCFLAVLVALY